MFIFVEGSKRRYFPHFFQAMIHAWRRQSRAVVEWVWDGPINGHHAVWKNERSYRQGDQPFATVREC